MPKTVEAEMPWIVESTFERTEYVVESHLPARLVSLDVHDRYHDGTRTIVGNLTPDAAITLGLALITAAQKAMR